jgi:integral membrane protein
MKLKIAKIIVSAFVALLVAQALNLSTPSAAAIIAILSVMDTKKVSLAATGQRLAAAVLALVIGMGIFAIFGFDVISFGLYLLCYIPLAYLLKVDIGVAPSTVLVIHLWTQQQLSFELFVNELLLVTIGAGVAILLNWYMPSYRQEIERVREEIEDKMREVLLKMSGFLTIGNGKNDGEVLQLLKEKLSEAREYVRLEAENHLTKEVTYDYQYFEMRRDQSNLLEIMATNLNEFRWDGEEMAILSEMFKQTAQQLAEQNTASQLIDDIEDLLEQFRERPLPQTRREFEKRAQLYQLLRDLKRFVQLKVDFFQTYGVHYFKKVGEKE